MRNPLAGYAVSVTGTLALLALVTGFVPGGSNQSLEPVTGATSRAKGENPLPRPLLHIPEQFREAMKQNLPSTPFAASGDRFPVLEVQSDGTVTMRPLHGSIPVKLETTSTSLAAMLTAAGRFCSPRGTVFEYAPHQSGGTRPSRCAGQTAGF